MNSVRTLGVCAALVLLGGCVAADPVSPQVLPVAQVTSAVPSSGGELEGFYDQAALRSLSLIEAYLGMSDVITAQAGDSPERMRNLVSEAWYPRELSGFYRYRETGEWTSGQTVFDNAVVQLARRTPEKTLDIGVFGCVDTTRVFVLGRDGQAPPEQVVQGHPDYDDDVFEDEDWALIAAFYEQDGLAWGDRRAIVFWLIGDSLDSLVIDSSSEWWGAHEC